MLKKGYQDRFVLLTVEKLNWTEAKEYCKNESMELATFNNLKEFETVSKSITAQFNGKDDYYRIYIDGRRTGPEKNSWNAWKWTKTDQQIDDRIFPMNRATLNNRNNEEDCLELFKRDRTGYIVNDIPCNHTLKYILCEEEACQSK